LVSSLVTVSLLAVTIDLLRLTLIPQLMCQRVRMNSKSANPSDIVSIIDIFRPRGPLKIVKNYFLFQTKNKKNLQL
jgi:hypothetical protein